MKKIIRGKKYDTDTATEVGTWSADLPVTDFDYEEETLYRKRTGEYFLHGSGGARSRYAEQSYGGWGGGEAITPLTYEQASEWAEEHMSADGYEAAFGEVDEDGGEVQIGVRISASAKRKLDRLAEGTTQSKVIEALIEAASL